MDAKQYYDQNAYRHSAGLEDPAVRGKPSQGLLANLSDDDVALDFIAPVGPFPRFLDVGCGDLEFLLRIKEIAPERYGLDISEYSSWKHHPEIRTQLFDLDRGGIPFEDGFFDGVSMLMVLEHVFDPFHAVREVSRVLKSGGHFVVNVPNIAYVKHRLKLLMGGLPCTSSPDSYAQGAWDGYHLHNFTLDSLEWLVREHGKFDVIRRGGSGKASRLRSVLPSLLTGDLTLLCRKR
jgi:SAM-dependent methyltransferase